MTPRMLTLPSMSSGKDGRHMPKPLSNNGKVKVNLWPWIYRFGSRPSGQRLWQWRIGRTITFTSFGKFKDSKQRAVKIAKAQGAPTVTLIPYS